MDVSVIICTRNRGALLRNALNSLTDQTLKKRTYEVIVIDNDSADDTSETVAAFADVLQIRYLHEPTLGLSRARNTGWINANGTYIAFLDDDAVASPDWLQELTAAFASRSETHTHICVGGTVSLRFNAKRPRWLSKELEPFLSGIDHADTLTVLSGSGQYLPGCNMAFKKSTLTHFGGFSEGVGRKGDDLLSDEDVLLQKRIERAGGTLLFAPRAAVIHHVAEDRLKRSWFLRRLYWEGISSVRVERATGSSVTAANELRKLRHEVCNRRFLLHPTFLQLTALAQRLGRISESLRASTPKDRGM